MAALRVGDIVYLAFGARMGYFARRAAVHVKDEIDVNVDVHADLKSSCREPVTGSTLNRRIA